MLIVANIRKLTGQNETVRNVTSCSSFHDNFRIYVALREFVCQLEADDLEALLLIASLEGKSNMLREKLSELEKVTKRLLREDATIESAPLYFNGVPESYLQLQNRLDPHPRIRHNLLF